MHGNSINIPPHLISLPCFLQSLLQNMTRTIILCYDHSPSSRYAVQWAVRNHLFLTDDSVVLATALEEDVVAIEGGALAIPNVVGGVGDFMVAEYAERVQKMEDNAETELKNAVEAIRKHVVSDAEIC
jgi:hypothetical protein